MTLSKKKRRKMVVEDKTYFWQATGNDHGIDLCVTGETKGGQKLFTAFDYKYAPAENPQHGETCVSQFVVTPYIVRQVIEIALNNGWKPFAKGNDFALQTDDKIDLRLDQNTAVNEWKLWSKINLKITD